MNRLTRWLIGGVLISLVLAGCQAAGTPIPIMPEPTESTQAATTAPTPQAPQEVRAKVDRSTAPQTAEADLQAAAHGNTEFAFDLYHHTAEGESGNVIFSPYSISLTFAMVYAGAHSDTETQIADVLHYVLPQAQLHPAFNALDLALEGVPDAQATQEAQSKETGDIILRIANALWGQQDLSFKDDFLNTLGLNYGAGMRLLDFKTAPEPARQQINQWVQEATEDRIKDLIPAGAIDEDTRLVLTNAIYFYGAWTYPFQADATQDAPFTTLDGSSVTVPMMQQSGMKISYASGDGYAAVEVPYGQSQRTAMILILPDDLAAFEATLNAEQFQMIREGFQPALVNLWMPKFDFESSFSLKEALLAMGMTAPFGEGGPADFSGITEQEGLQIGAVIHKANITVDEEGTEAAAATAIIMETTAAMEPPPTHDLRLDHPFIFAIMDRSTGTLLFLGRVADPSK